MVNVRPLAPQAPPWSRSPPGVCVCLGSWAGKDGSGANGQLPQLTGCIRRWSVPFTPGGACLSFSSLPLPSPPSLSCLIFLPFSRSPPPLLPSGSWCGIATAWCCFPFLSSLQPCSGVSSQTGFALFRCSCRLELRAAVHCKQEVRRAWTRAGRAL